MSDLAAAIKAARACRLCADELPLGQRPVFHLDAGVRLLLRQRRLELGLSQAGLAAKLGLTFQQVQKYEKGVNQLAVARLLQICKVLRVPVRYFVGEPAVPGRNEAVDLKLERTLAKIRSRAVKRALLGLAKPLA